MDGQETEVKFYVRQIKRVEERLQALGARLIQPRVYEVNLRFDSARREPAAGRESAAPAARRAGTLDLQRSIATNR